MEFIDVKCKKCGYEILIPEKTENVICGSCGNINYYGKISSILKKYTDTAEPAGYRRIPDLTIKSPEKTAQGWTQNSSEGEPPADEDEVEFTEEKSVSKILTVLFILAPFIAMAVEFFKLPSYAALVIIFIVIGIIFYLKK